MHILTINGEKREFANGQFPATLIALLEGLSIAPTTVVIELNGTVIPRGAYAEQALLNGDTVEIVQLVGGGC